MPAAFTQTVKEIRADLANRSVDALLSSCSAPSPALVLALEPGAPHFEANGFAHWSNLKGDKLRMVHPLSEVKKKELVQRALRSKDNSLSIHGRSRHI